MGFREAGLWKGHSLSFALGKHSAYLTSIQPHRLRYSVQGMAPSHIDKDITANYEMENLELASGGFGKVFRATDRKHPERRVAIKSMLLSSARRREMSENEVKIMPLALTMPQMIFDMEWGSICTLHARAHTHTHTHRHWLRQSIYIALSTSFSSDLSWLHVDMKRLECMFACLCLCRCMTTRSCEITEQCR